MHIFSLGYHYCDKHVPWNRWWRNLPKNSVDKMDYFVTQRNVRCEHSTTLRPDAWAQNGKRCGGRQPVIIRGRGERRRRRRRWQRALAIVQATEVHFVLPPPIWRHLFRPTRRNLNNALFLCHDWARLRRRRRWPQ